MLLPLSDFWCTSLMLQNGHAAAPPATAVTDCTHRRRAAPLAASATEDEEPLPTAGHALIGHGDTFLVRS